MYRQRAIVQRISMVSVGLLLASTIACGRTPAGSAGTNLGGAVQDAQLVEFEYPGQRASQPGATVITPATGAAPAFDPDGPTLVP